jgi:hypothetical protein
MPMEIHWIWEPVFDHMGELAYPSLEEELLEQGKLEAFSY